MASGCSQDVPTLPQPSLRSPRPVPRGLGQQEAAPTFCTALRRISLYSSLVTSLF